MKRYILYFVIAIFILLAIAILGINRELKLTDSKPVGDIFTDAADIKASEIIPIIPDIIDEPQEEVEEEIEPEISPEILEQLKDSEIQTYANGNVRKFPYPYKAMLSIISDSDCATPKAFEKTHRFLNTKEETEYGQGLGLDISDSFWIYAGSDLEGTENNMTYFDGLDYNKTLYADLIEKYINCGWLDSIHTFGDFSRKGYDINYNRELAIKAWEVVSSLEIPPITVWIDHGTETNLQNFGAYNPKNVSKYQQGDNPDAPDYYHTDMTLENNIRFAWHSRHSDMFGYDFPLVEKTLRDGQKVWGFYRYCCEMNGNEILWNWSPDKLHLQLTAEHLDGIIENSQYGMVAQHLNYFGDDYSFSPEAVASLRLLAKYNDEKEILVARTSRALAYCVTQNYIRYNTVDDGENYYINLLMVDDPVSGPREILIDEIKGLTFYTDNPNTFLLINGNPIPKSDYEINPADESNRQSVSIKWFEPDYTDYTLSY